MTTRLYLEIRDYLRSLLEGTEWEGHVFAVGGCCRDEIMGTPIKDVDLAVDLPAGGIRFAEWLASKKLTLHKPVTFPTYGTAMLHLRAFPDDEIELVQTRKEKYPDRGNRNPETVFGSLEEDCLRRDLTINSLYFDISRRRFVDITGLGIDDIRNKIIRTPCDPDITYDDDPLRILRCIRFASRFGWEVEKNTYDGMVRNHHRLKIITAERIKSELDKMLTCAHPVMALEMMRDTGALEFVVAELTQFEAPQWEETLRSVELIGNTLTLRMAALLHLTGSKAADILRCLKYSNDFISSVTFLISGCEEWGQKIASAEMIDDKELRRLQLESGSQSRFYELMDFISAIFEASGQGEKSRIKALRDRTDGMLTCGTAMFGYRLPVGGKEVMQKKGITPGPAVKQCLDYLMEEALANPLLTGTQLLTTLDAFTPHS